MPSFAALDQLLSPPLEKLSQHSRKSNSSADSKGSYFSSASSRAAVSLRNSEGPMTPSLLAAGLLSPSCGSDYGSENSSGSSYLTPPQWQVGNEKAPYKARSPSSASLNMAANQNNGTAHRNQKLRAKKQRPKHKRKLRLETNDEQSKILPEHGCRSTQCLASCKRGSSTACNSGCDRLGTFVKSIGGLKNTIRSGTEDHQDCSTQFMSGIAPIITTSRWSSVGIGADALPRNSVFASSSGPESRNNGQNGNKSWIHGSDNDEIMSAVRARLTFREVPGNQLPTPATITLRRASGMSTHNSGVLAKCDSDINVSLLPQLGTSDEPCRPLSSYLITTDDIDFIISLIRSGFDIRRTTIDLRDRNAEAFRKPSVTSNGILPQSSAPADLATTIADVHQASNIPRVSFKDPKSPASKQTMDCKRKLSRAVSLQNVPEVIWEDVGSPESLSSDCNKSHTSEERPEAVAESDTWLFGQSSSTRPEASLPHTASLGDHQRSSSDDEDNSPTSRVSKWVFKEPTEEMERTSGQFPEKSYTTTLDARVESPTAPSKRNSFPSITLFSPDVVSFPPLLARSRTSDWFSPLPDMNATAFDDSTSLCGAPIDAQMGGTLKDPKTSLLNIGQRDAPMEAAEQQQESPSPDLGPQMRRKSAHILHPPVSPRLGDSFKVGNAIGSSSGARRKSSTRSMHLKINDETLEHHYHEDQTCWTKPRKDSGWPALISSSPEELDSRRGSHALPPSSMQPHGLLNKGKTKTGGKV